MKVCSGSNNIYLRFEFFLHVMQILFSLNKSLLAPLRTVALHFPFTMLLCAVMILLLLHLSVCQSIVAFMRSQP
jgi:hypothetical protein